MIRVHTVMGLIGLFVAFPILINSGPVRASPPSRLVFQDTATPGYNAPNEDTPTNTSGYQGPGQGGTETAQPLLTPSVISSPTLTATVPPNTFQTEDSEINKSLTTPVASDTPAPTNTVFSSATAAVIGGGTTPTPLSNKKEAGFAIDWGLFWIGFSLPLIGLCGMVLYLLDRRPDLFKRFRK